MVERENTGTPRQHQRECRHWPLRRSERARRAHSRASHASRSTAGFVDAQRKHAATADV
jgi:hypothetical protein